MALIPSPPCVASPIPCLPALIIIRPTTSILNCLIILHAHWKRCLWNTHNMLAIWILLWAFGWDHLFLVWTLNLLSLNKKNMLEVRKRIVGSLCWCLDWGNLIFLPIMELNWSILRNWNSFLAPPSININHEIKLTYYRNIKYSTIFFNNKII